MTTLEAVNELLAGLGDPPVTALDTGGSSDAAEAEDYLARAMREIVLDGWPQTADEDREIPLPTFKLTITGSTGTFEWGETVSIGAVDVVFSHIETVSGTTYMYVSGATTPSTGTATGDDSGATRTVTAVVAITTSKIGVGTDWTAIRASKNETTRITVRDGFLFNLDDLTSTFYGSVRLDIRRDGTFTDLTDALQQYVTKWAAVLFQRYKKRGETDDGFLMQNVARARTVALRERQSHRRTNLNNTAEAYAIAGGRAWIAVQTGA